MTKEEAIEKLRENYNFTNKFIDGKIKIENLNQKEMVKFNLLTKLSHLYPYISLSILLKDILECNERLEEILSEEEKKTYKKEIDDFFSLISEQDYFKDFFVKPNIFQHINGHEYVDLGLPSGLKWATCNVPINNPDAYGEYYAWGEIKPKSDYNESNSEVEGWEGNSQYDAATVNWGGTWRMPTKEELKELVDECTWEWMTHDNINGYKVTGPNGNSIFLPAAGYRYNSSLHNAGELGFYWSSTTDDKDYCKDVYFLGIDESGRYLASGAVFYGRSVRPVSK